MRPIAVSETTAGRTGGRVDAQSGGMVCFRRVRALRGAGVVAPAGCQRSESVRNRTFVHRERVLIRGFLIPVLLGLLFGVLSAGCGGGRPPLPSAFTAVEADSSGYLPEIDQYRVLVSDDLSLTVLGYPELSGSMKVLPDGTITTPGVGSIYVLGSTLDEATLRIREELSKIARYPQATLAVSNFGDRRVFVMGEVDTPGGQPYHRGMTVLGAIAQAGGFAPTAKRGSVLILRRLGRQEAIAIRVDANDLLKGKNLEKDTALRPFDIVYVPKTFIAGLNLLMDQYFRNLTPPFTLYLEGWNSFHADDQNIRFIAR